MFVSEGGWYPKKLMFSIHKWWTCWYYIGIGLEQRENGYDQDFVCMWQKEK